MIRLITRTILIVVICVGLALVVLHVARASGTGYSADPASNTQAPATTQSSPQWLSTDAGPSSASASSSSTSIAPTAATPLPGNTAEPQGQAEPQEQAEPQGQAEPQEQAEPQDQELSGTVASSDSTHSAFTLRTASGVVTVYVTGLTEYSDGLYRLADVHSGAYVSVDVNRQTDGHLVATDVKASNGSSDPSETNSSNSAADGN